MFENSGTKLIIVINCAGGKMMSVTNKKAVTTALLAFRSLLL